jgi:polysaccharide export outer membrane protein
MRWSVLAVALLVPVLAGCAMNRVATYPVTSPAAYTLDTGDVVRVTVYGDTTLSTTYTVTDKGTLSFPLIGQVMARGQTITVVEKQITDRLAAGYMVAPKVSVEVSAYRPFFIDGAVSKSGQYPYVWGMTARAAVATAEGFKDFADRTHVTIYRRMGKAMAKFSSSLDAPVMPGDTIVVGERWL